MGGVTEDYHYDAGDKLTSITQGLGTLKSFAYDAQGRTTSVTTPGGTTSYSYDYEDRLTGISYPSAATNAFAYNAFDTRVGKTDSAGTATFMRDGVGVCSPVLSDGNSSFTPGVSQRSGTTSTFQAMDRLGTFSLETNASQSVSATRQFDAFGNQTGTTGAPTTPFAFAGAWGYQQDPDSSLQLLGHRYYDPSTGRFLTRDPAKDGRNWYGYCANNPLRHVDPRGHRLSDSLLAVGTWIDNNLLGGAVADAGDAYGQWEAGTGSGWVAAGKCLKAIAMIAVLAVSIVDGAGELEAGGTALEGGEEATIGERLANPDLVVEGHEGLPYTGPSEGVGARIGPDGTLRQIRVWTEDGGPGIDIDWGHDHGFGDPHFHLWPGGFRDEGNSF